MSLLAHETWAGNGPPLLLLHGFTGNRSTFAHLRERLTPHASVVAVDLPGHGQSPISAETTFASTLAALLALLEALGLAWVDVAGYSLGARVALGLAVESGPRVRRLVLESGSPGLRRRRDRGERRRQDEALATRIESDGMDAFVEHWEALPLFSGVRALSAEVQQALRGRRLAGDAEGLAWSLRRLGLGSQPSYWSALPNVRTPTLLLSGARDEKFTEVAGRMAAELPVVWGHVFPGVGHAPHLEAPDAWALEVSGFLSTPWIERPLVESDSGSNG
ncbi:MAG: 2-succinyl-6-hydroxy-2,4-cyclohexadiene-1-carboxylate synthase [Myxococcaceae bacterium]